MLSGCRTRGTASSFLFGNREEYVICCASCNPDFFARMAMTYRRTQVIGDNRRGVERAGGTMRTCSSSHVRPRPATNALTFYPGTSKNSDLAQGRSVPIGIGARDQSVRASGRCRSHRPRATTWCVELAGRALYQLRRAFRFAVGNTELATAAPAALRDVFGHTLLFFGMQDGKNAAGYTASGAVSGRKACRGRSCGSKRSTDSSPHQCSSRPAV